MGAFAHNRLVAAGKALLHRGPDDGGTEWLPEHAVGLCHRRLSIIDLSPLGRQPMWDVSHRAIVTFNGEIYNFRELRDELEDRGFRFRSHSDTEVVLNLYLAEGAGMLSRLNGIFAFALWDQLHQSLLLARDALGVKPLYYTTNANGIAFASEIKALLVLAPQARELDHEALHRYLSFLWCPGEHTALRSVRKLLPGEAMVIQDGKIRRHWAWYQLPQFRGICADLNEVESAAGTAQHLRRAVHRQLVADVPVGAFLSGGLDSSAVVAFAREKVPEMRCFSIEAVGGADAGDTNDLPYARRVAQHLGVPLDVVQVDSSRMASDLASMVTLLEEPLADPAPLNVLYISRLARENGIKVLLSGAGGDDLFTGYRRHLAMKYEHLWHWLPKQAQIALQRAAVGLDQRIPFARRLAKLFAGSGLSGGERITSYFVWAQEQELLPLYTPAFRAEITQSASQPMLDFLAPLPETLASLDKLLALEQRFFLADHNLLYTDKMSMAAGVEVRVPFLDLDLVDHAARVPLRLKQRGRTGKWVLKKAMESYLPREVIYRPKTGFGAPVRRWIRNELRPLIDDLLSPEVLSRRGLFTPAAVQDLIRKNDTGETDAAYTLLALIGIELWCRAYLDGSFIHGEGRV